MKLCNHPLFRGPTTWAELKSCDKLAVTGYRVEYQNITTYRWRCEEHSKSDKISEYPVVKRFSDEEFTVVSILMS